MFWGDFFWIFSGVTLYNTWDALPESFMACHACLCLIKKEDIAVLIFPIKLLLSDVIQVRTTTVLIISRIFNSAHWSDLQCGFRATDFCREVFLVSWYPPSSHFPFGYFHWSTWLWIMPSWPNQILVVTILCYLPCRLICSQIESLWQKWSHRGS